MKSLIVLIVSVVVVCVSGSSCKNPCEGPSVCEYGALCSVDETGEAICNCRAGCTRELRWVCGSDGKSYMNECLLQLNACERRRRIFMVNEGKCKDSATKCASTSVKPTTSSSKLAPKSTVKTANIEEENLEAEVLGAPIVEELNEE